MNPHIQAERLSLRGPPLLRSLLLVLLLLPVAPAAASEIERLQRLVQQGDYATAYALAHQHRAELEGDPNSDFYYGVAALESGDPGEAVFALRRALAVRPSIGVRFQLARGWFLMGEDLQARREFERVLAGDPPEPVRAQTERYLYALDRRSAHYRTRISGHVELGRGRDSNVTTATDDDVVVLSDQTIGIDELGDGARAQADDFIRVAGDLRVSHPVAPGLNAFVEFEGERRYHPDWTDLETGHGQVRAGVVSRSERVRTALAARGRRFYVGGDRHRDTAGLDASVRYTFSELQVAQAAAGFAQLRHADARQRARDSDLATLVVGTTRLWRAPLRPSLSLFALHGRQAPASGLEDPTDAERSKRAGAERDLSGVGGDVRLQIASRWVARGGLRHRRSSYPATDPVFGRSRRDNYTSADLALRWHPALHWRVQAQLSRTVNESTINFHDYERDLSEVSLRYQF